MDSNINKAHACIQNVLLQSREYEQTIRRHWREESKTETQLSNPPLLLLLVVLRVHGCLTENVMCKCAMCTLVRSVSLHSQKEGCAIRGFHSGTCFQTFVVQGRQHAVVMSKSGRTAKRSVVF